MTPEFLEYELRRLPDVVSVSVDESAVTLLVNPAADADALRVIVAGMLATAGVDLAVTVLGGVGGAVIPPRRVAPIAVGSAAGVGVLAAAVAVAALTGVLHLGAPDVHPRQTAQRPPAAATPLTSVPNFGPSTTLLPGAPLLAPQGSSPSSASSASSSGSPASSSASASSSSETAGANAGPGGTGTGPAIDLHGTPGGGIGNGPGGGQPVVNQPELPVGPPSGPPSDYVTDAPAVRPPDVWPARADASEPVPVVPEGTA